MELAEEKNVLEQVHADVDAVAGLVKENKKLAGNQQHMALDYSQQQLQGSLTRRQQCASGGYVQGAIGAR